MIDKLRKGHYIIIYTIMVIGTTFIGLKKNTVKNMVSSIFSYKGDFTLTMAYFISIVLIMGTYYLIGRAFNSLVNSRGSTEGYKLGWKHIVGWICSVLVIEHLTYIFIMPIFMKIIYLAPDMIFSFLEHICYFLIGASKVLCIAILFKWQGSIKNFKRNLKLFKKGKVIGLSIILAIIASIVSIYLTSLSPSIVDIINGNGNGQDDLIRLLINGNPIDYWNAMVWEFFIAVIFIYGIYVNDKIHTNDVTSDGVQVFENISEEIESSDESLDRQPESAEKPLNRKYIGVLLFWSCFNIFIYRESWPRIDMEIWSEIICWVFWSLTCYSIITLILVCKRQLVQKAKKDFNRAVLACVINTVIALGFIVGGVVAVCIMVWQYLEREEIA